MFLIQRLVSTPNAESRKEIIHQEETLIDETFFALVNRLVEASLMEGDKQSAQQLSIFQKELLEETEVGRKIQEQMKDSQKAMEDIQNIAKQGLTREKLLDLFIQSPSEVYSSTLIGMTRTGIDYEFFAIITQKIESTSDQEQKDKLVALRDYLTEAIKQIDEQIQIEMKNAREMVDKIISAPTIESGLQQYGNQVNDFFVEAVQTAIADARKNSDLEKLAKLNQLNTMIEEANKPPESFQFIEELLKTADENSLKDLLNQNIEKVNDEFIQMLAGVISQSEEQGNQPQLVDKLKQIQRMALRVSMAKNLKN
jgi:DNA-binding phage protein